MSVLISKLGPRKKTRLGKWVVLFMVVWAALSVASIVISRMEGQRFPVGYLILMCGIGTVCLMFMTMGYVLDKPQPIELSQSLELDRTILTITEPSPWEIDFAADSAYVLCLHKGDPTYASIRFLRDEEDITIYCHASEHSVQDLWVSGDAEPPPGTWLEGHDYREKFGLALLHQVRTNKHKNRFWTELQQLSETRLRHADDPNVVTLGDDDDDDALSYRSSGKPGPADPGFGAWLASYAQRISDAVFLSDQHLVAECRDGLRRAFPIGTLRVKREPGGLKMWATGAAYSFALDDSVMAEALLERLRLFEGQAVSIDS